MSQGHLLNGTWSASTNGLGISLQILYNGIALLVEESGEVMTRLRLLLP